MRWATSDRKCRKCLQRIMQLSLYSFFWRKYLRYAYIFWFMESTPKLFTHWEKSEPTASRSLSCWNTGCRYGNDGWIVLQS